MVQERRNIPVDTFTAPELYPAEHGGGDELTSSQMSRSYEVRYEKMEGEEASDIEDDFFIVDASEIKPLKVGPTSCLITRTSRKILSAARILFTWL